MTKRIILLLIMLQSTSIFSQNLQTKLQFILEQNQLMGLTVQTIYGKKETTYNVGLRNEANKLLVTDDTKFRIASISKSFAALGLMKLYDKKLFKLDDDISTCLGYKIYNPNFPDDKITFRMLLSHTSTLNDGEGYDAFLGATYKETPIPSINSVFLENGKYFTKDMWLIQKPGTFFTYCNLNFGIIGTLIEKISKERFDVYMKKEILKPLKINTGYSIQDIADVENVATLYRTENNAWKPSKDDYNGVKPAPTDFTNFIIGNNGSYFGPQGGMRASAKDLAKFLKFLKSDGASNPKVISAKTLKLMKTAQWTFKEGNGDNYNGFFKRYGLGLHLTNTDGTDKMSDAVTFGNFIGHAGDAYGLISDAYFSDKLDFGVVLITNGCFIPFEKGKSTSFYKFEEEILQAVTEDYLLNEKSKKKK